MTGKSPGRMLMTPTENERKASASRIADTPTQMKILRSSSSIMRALLRAAMAGSPVTEIS